MFNFAHIDRGIQTALQTLGALLTTFLGYLLFAFNFKQFQARRTIDDEKQKLDLMATLDGRYDELRRLTSEYYAVLEHQLELKQAVLDAKATIADQNATGVIKDMRVEQLTKDLAVALSELRQPKCQFPKCGLRSRCWEKPIQEIECGKIL